MNTKIIYPWTIQNNAKYNFVSKSYGSFFWINKKRYLDFCSQLVNLNIGFQNKKIIKTINEQSKKQIFIGPNFKDKSREKLGKEISKLLGRNLYKSFFSESGARANEVACIIARKVTKKRKILSRKTSYHGSTNFTASISGDARRNMINATDKSNVKFLVDPICYKCPLNKEYPSCNLACASELESILKHDNNFAAVIMEPITGSAGRIVPPKGYYEKISKICKKHNTLLIFDEIMTGFGRTGKWFGFHHWKVKPDMVTLAKGITGGMLPLAATVFSKKISKYFDENYFPTGLTNYAHPLSCAVALKTINIMKQEKLIIHSKKIEKLMIKYLNKIKTKYSCVGDFRGKGCFYAIEFVNEKSGERLIEWKNINYFKKVDFIENLKKICWKKGLYCYSRFNLLYICPPINTDLEDVEHGLKIIDISIQETLQKK